MNTPCRRCLHERRDHQHYTSATNCALCACPAFRRPWWGWLRTLWPQDAVEWAAVVMIAVLAAAPLYWLHELHVYDHCLGASHSVTRAESCAGAVPAPSTAKGMP